MRGNPPALARKTHAWRVAHRDSPCEAVRMLNLVELKLDRLAQLNLVDVAENEGGLDDLAKGFQRPIQRVLLRIGIESPKNFRGGGFFEHDRRDQAQNVVPNSVR